MGGRQPWIGFKAGGGTVQGFTSFRWGSDRLLGEGVFLFGEGTLLSRESIFWFGGGV